MSGVLPRISEAGEKLVSETADFLFLGEPTDQLHPDIAADACYPGGVIMPVSELPGANRHSIVSMALAHSVLKMSIDSFGSLDIKGRYASQVANPLAYLDLYKVGIKANKLARRGPILREEDLESDKISPLAAAGGMVYALEKLLADNPDMLKESVRRLHYAEPMLKEGETEAMREAKRRYALQRREQRWRYARPLAVAAASGFLLFNSYQDSQAANVRDPAIIAELSAERAEATEARTEQIDKEIQRLQLQMNGGDATFWGFIAGAALFKTGWNYLDRPRPKTAE